MGNHVLAHVLFIISGVVRYCNWLALTLYTFIHEQALVCTYNLLKYPVFLLCWKGEASDRESEMPVFWKRIDLRSLIWNLHVNGWMCQFDTFGDSSMQSQVCVYELL